jgi:hypothetical protein
MDEQASRRVGFHGRLREAWEKFPNDLLSVSRVMSDPRTPDAACAPRNTWQPKAKRTHLLFGSALGESPGRVNGHFDPWQLSLLVGLLNRLLFVGFLPRSLGGEGRWGCGGGKLGVLLVSAPAEAPTDVILEIAGSAGFQAEGSNRRFRSPIRQDRAGGRNSPL